MCGTFPSLKNNALVPFESLLEADLIALMEQDQDITAYFAQPETFCWRASNRKVRRYTPDFLVIYSDGRRAYREVKPTKHLRRDESLRGRRSRIELECSARGASFEVWTEKDIRPGTFSRV